MIEVFKLKSKIDESKISVFDFMDILFWLSIRFVSLLVYEDYIIEPYLTIEWTNVQNNVTKQGEKLKLVTFLRINPIKHIAFVIMVSIYGRKSKDETITKPK